MVIWLLEHTKTFPKHQRFVLAQRMEEAALSFQDTILWATKTGRKLPALLDADDHLERLRLYNRIAVRMRLSSPGQLEHLSRMLEELGRLLGGWMRKLRMGRLGHRFDGGLCSERARTNPSPVARPRGVRDHRVNRGGSWCLATIAEGDSTSLRM
jgi:hypothetical protein